MERIIGIIYRLILLVVWGAYSLIVLLMVIAFVKGAPGTSFGERLIPIYFIIGYGMLAVGLHFLLRWLIKPG